MSIYSACVSSALEMSMSSQKRNLVYPAEVSGKGKKPNQIGITSPNQNTTKYRVSVIRRRGYYNFQHAGPRGLLEAFT